MIVADAEPEPVYQYAPVIGGWERERGNGDQERRGGDTADGDLPGLLSERRHDRGGGESAPAGPCGAAGCAGPRDTDTVPVPDPRRGRYLLGEAGVQDASDTGGVDVGDDGAELLPALGLAGGVVRGPAGTAGGDGEGDGEVAGDGDAVGVAGGAVADRDEVCGVDPGGCGGVTESGKAAGGVGVGAVVIDVDGHSRHTSRRVVLWCCAVVCQRSP